VGVSHRDDSCVQEAQCLLIAANERGIYWLLRHIARTLWVPKRYLHRGARLVKVLRYKPAGRGFDS
jgi:hypothetical protein